MTTHQNSFAMPYPDAPARGFDRARAREIIARLKLEATNRAVADYWLSLWEGDALPPRTKFNPARIKQFLRGLVLFDVVPDEGVTIRLAGTGFAFLLGTELTGKDWIAMAPEGYRAERLRIFSVIARGAVGVGHRRIDLYEGTNFLSEEILLPFAAAPGANNQQVLTRLNWPDNYFIKIKSAEQAAGIPLSFETIPLP
jgi:hypothetical protein